MIDTVLHALDELSSLGESYEYVALLQPTSPLRDASHIDAAAATMREAGSSAVVSVCPAEHSPLLMNTLPADRRMGEFLRPEAQAYGRQALPDYYRLNGAIYLIETKTLLAEKRFIGRFAVAYVMPVEASVDVDDAFDLIVAAAAMEQTK